MLYTEFINCGFVWEINLISSRIWYGTQQTRYLNSLSTLKTAAVVDRLLARIIGLLVTLYMRAAEWSVLFSTVYPKQFQLDSYKTGRMNMLYGADDWLLGSISSAVVDQYAKTITSGVLALLGYEYKVHSEGAKNILGRDLYLTRLGHLLWRGADALNIRGLQHTLLILIMACYSWSSLMQLNE